MNNFQLYTPTRVYFGNDAEQHIGPALQQQNCRKVLVHYGIGSVVKNGILDKVTSQLEAAKIDYVLFGGAEPNPKLGLVREGIELCRKENVDFILAVGGGSVIDSAKAMGLGLAGNRDPWDYFTGAAVPEKSFPIGAVVTIAAAGSETSNSCVITNEEEKLKRSVNSDLNRPVMAFMNPEFTFTVSPYQTSCGIVDIMMHTLERYFNSTPYTPLTDSFAESLLICVRDAGRIALENPEDYDARATLLWASSVSHSGITGCGKNTTFTCHKLEHDVSGVFDKVAHGAGLAVLFPAWAMYVYKKDLARFCRYAERVWDISPQISDEDTAKMGIKATKSFFKSIGMPTTMCELGITPEHYHAIANKSTYSDRRTIPSYVSLHKKDILDIYKLAE